MRCPRIRSHKNETLRPDLDLKIQDRLINSHHHHHVPEGLGVFLFLDPQDEVGPSFSSSVVLCFFVLLVYIVMLVLVVCLCPSSVRVVATFSGTVLFPLLCSVLPFFA